MLTDLKFDKPKIVYWIALLNILLCLAVVGLCVFSCIPQEEVLISFSNEEEMLLSEDYTYSLMCAKDLINRENSKITKFSNVSWILNKTGKEDDYTSVFYATIRYSTEGGEKNAYYKLKRIYTNQDGYPHNKDEITLEQIDKKTYNSAKSAWLTSSNDDLKEKSYHTTVIQKILDSAKGDFSVCP